MASLTGDHKPLPQIPSNPTTGEGLPLFTPAATTHLNRILVQAFQGENLSLQWLPHIEGALSHLADAVRMGDWISGARRKTLALRAPATTTAEPTASSITTPSKTTSKAESVLKATLDADKDEEKGALAALEKHIALGPPTPASSTANHLLITLAPPDARHFPDLGIDFDLRPHREACAFTPGSFSLPHYDEEGTAARHGRGGIILAGFEEWKAIYSEPSMADLRIVGGDFVLKGVHAKDDHAALTRVLRLGVYAVLSIQIELSLFRDHRIPLKYPPPPKKPIISNGRIPTSAPTSPQKPKTASRRSQASSGIWSFLTKKTEGILKPHHSAHPSTADQLSSPSPTSHHFPHRVSLDLVRTFSHHMGLSTSDHIVQGGSPIPSSTNSFTNIITKISQPAAVYSTSPDVHFPAPTLLSRLALRETSLIENETWISNGKLRLTGVDKAGLATILGWTNSFGAQNVLNEAESSRELTGTRAFVRHQGITVLYAEHVPASLDPPVKALVDSNEERSEPSTSTGASSLPSTSHLTSTDGFDPSSLPPLPPSPVPPSDPPSRPTTKPCVPAYWRTYRFFSPSSDISLGDFILDVCSSANELCSREGCGRSRAAHGMDWVHAAVKITGRVEAVPEDEVEDDDEIFIWNSCAICRKKTENVRMSNGAFMCSFAKFLELLVYSLSFGTLTPTLCEHTSDASSTSDHRYNILRHFRHGSHVFTLASSRVDADVFEVKVPRIQIVKSVAEVRKIETTVTVDNAVTEEESLEEVERDDLRLEITYWWSGLKEHIGKLEDFLAGETARMRTKRLPSTPGDSDDERPKKGKGKAKEDTLKVPSSTNGSRSSSPQPADEPLPESRPDSRLSPDLYTLLHRLRQSFTDTELGLYKALSDAPSHNLNDVRRRFRSAAEGAKRRMAAWQAKHIKSAKEIEGFNSVEYQPEWWGPGHHVMPNSRVIIREKDWGSIIAFTMNSNEYKRELTNMVAGRFASSSTAPTTPMETQRPSIASTPSSVSILSKASASASTSKLSAQREVTDPDASDDETHPWQDEDESYSAVITRKEHPKEGAGILGLRDVLRSQRSVETPPATPGSAMMSTSGSSNSGMATAGVSSRFRSLGNSASKLMRYGLVPSGSQDLPPPPPPPSAWAKAELEISLQPAQGEFRALSGTSQITSGYGGERLSDIMAQVEQHAAEATSSTLTSSSSADSGRMTLKSAPSKLVKAPSAVEEGDEERSLTNSTATLEVPTTTVEGDTVIVHSRESTGATIGPPVPPKDDIDAGHNLPATPAPKSRVLVNNDVGIGSSASTTGSITSTVASAIRYVIGAQAPSPPPKSHLGLLSMHPGQNQQGALYPPIDDRPHLKYDFTLGKKLKFSCTVYYARQFDFLRKRCGIQADTGGTGLSETDLIRSLEKCVGWEAEGGKSKSSFLKTQDDRFIIKTLVNAWNVADLQVLLELAPSYFRYMDTTASHASVLAKLMGFYTIEVQNLDPKGGAGAVKMKADLLVMENLFWNLSIEPGRTFDLKGISGRKVKQPAGGSSKEKDKGPTSDEPSKESSSSKDTGERRRVKPTAVKSMVSASHKPLYDGEWIEGQQRAMVLVEPYSKAVLREAIRCDAEFLAKSNIMDYSLLLGIDQQRRQMACGLVDTIGSYTFAKTLEYKAKQGLIGGSGKEITVVPPAEYQERFANAMESYFFASPDKWSKPASPSLDLSAVEDLPAVF